MSKKHGAQSRNDSVLFAIGVYKLFTGAVIAAAAAGVTQLFHRDVEAHAKNSVAMLSIDPDKGYLGTMLHGLHAVHTRELKQLAVFGLCYSMLFLTEGGGLIMGQRWALWLTVVATSVFLPVEIYEIAVAPSILKVALFLINATIVTWLVFRLKKKET